MVQEDRGIRDDTGLRVGLHPGWPAPVSSRLYPFQSGFGRDRMSHNRVAVVFVSMSRVEVGWFPGTIYIYLDSRDGNLDWSFANLDGDQRSGEPFSVGSGRFSAAITECSRGR